MKQASSQGNQTCKIEKEAEEKSIEDSKSSVHKVNKLTIEPLVVSRRMKPIPRNDKCGAPILGTKTEATRPGTHNHERPPKYPAVFGPLILSPKPLHNNRPRPRNADINKCRQKVVWFLSGCSNSK